VTTPVPGPGSTRAAGPRRPGPRAGPHTPDPRPADLRPAGPCPPGPRTPEPRTPDPDGVALAVATAAGVGAVACWELLRHGVAVAGLAAAAAGLAGMLLAARRVGLRRRPRLAGVLALAVLVCAGAAVAGARAAAVRAAVLPAAVDATVEVDARVAEEPRATRFGGRWVVLTVGRVGLGGRTWRTRERAGVVLDGSVGPLGAGDRLRLRARIAPARRADPLGREPPVVLRRPVVLSISRPAPGLLRASEVVRAAAREQAAASLPPERAGLLVGIALGDTSRIPGELDAAFRAAGLTHLVAVSGSNLAVVLAAGLGIAALLGAGRPLLVVLGVLLVGLFVLLTRWEPSVLRAGVMAVLVLLGVATGRGPGGRRSLCLAVLLLLLADPGLFGSLGFRLSVAATAGVLWLGPPLASALPGRLSGPTRLAAGMTLGAQAGALPVLALALGRASPAGLPANLLALPLVAGPMLLGVVAAVAAPVAPALAAVACRLAEPFLAALVWIATWAAGLPGASAELAGPARLAPAALAAVVVVLARRRARTLDRRAAERRRRAPATPSAPPGPRPL
jgi:competence protein ComEC